MSVDVKAETVVEVARADVAAIMFNPKSDMIWIGGLTQVFPQTPGILKKGSRVERRGNLAGRGFISQLEVTNDDPGRLLEMSGTEPFEMKIRYELADAEKGTSVKIRIQSIGDLDIPMPPAVLSNQVREAITEDLKKLKKHLENNRG